MWGSKRKREREREQRERERRQPTSRFGGLEARAVSRDILVEDTIITLVSDIGFGSMFI